MSTAYGGGGGGGGGFGGFPYRSAHQQGRDGRGRGHRRRSYPRKRKKPPSLLCATDIVIPASQRVRLIGRDGNVIKQLRESTGATIFVPNNDRNTNRQTDTDKRPVRVKAESVASLLHACWRIVHLGLNVGEKASCKVRIPSNGPNLCGKVERAACFFSANDHSMSVYCVESFLNDEEVDTIVDNEKFADNTNMQYETVYLHLEGYPTTLVFAYGPDPKALAQSLKETTISRWTNECTSDICPSESTLSSGTLTIGTYNILHPIYAQKYNERAGLTITHESNWDIRAPAIACILLESSLDIYLLQEVESNGLFSKLSDSYLVVSYLHPSREAGDRVAILARKDRFVVEKQEMVPFKSKENPSEHYMCAATALLKDTATNLHYLVASTHFYKRKSQQPDDTLLEYLETHKSECDVIIWGGDCNDEYKRSIPSGYFAVNGNQCTRGHKTIDWVFYSPGCEAWRSTESEAFVDATMKHLEPTGSSPSDHYGEAITLNPPKLS